MTQPINREHEKPKALVIKYAINEDTGRLERIVTVEDAPTEGETLDFLYKHIGCKFVDTAQVKRFTFWVDDNGLFISDNPVFQYEDTKIAGNIVISNGTDEIGRTIWLDPLDVIEATELIKQSQLLGVTA